MIPSPFLDRSRWIAENGVAFAIRDAFPVSPGHTLVIPKRQVVSLWDLDLFTYRDVWAFVRVVRYDLLKDFEPTPHAFNVGVNDGETAGQTVAHAHIHIIPRYFGDVENPRGGVRGVIPSKRDYTP